MTPPDILNIVGLCINILGALLIFFNTPEVSFQVYLYHKEEEEQLEREAKRKNNLSRFGMLLIGLGFVVQLTAMFL